MAKKYSSVWNNMTKQIALEMANSIEENKNKMVETWELGRKLTPAQKNYVEGLEERIKDYRDFANELPSITKEKQEKVA